VRQSALAVEVKTAEDEDAHKQATEALSKLKK
jgi:hypothetical protein